MMPEKSHRTLNGKAEQKLFKDCTVVYILGHLKTSQYASNHIGKLYALDLDLN